MLGGHSTICTHLYVESETKTEKERAKDFSGYEHLGFWARTVPTKDVCVCFTDYNTVNRTQF